MDSGEASFVCIDIMSAIVRKKPFDVLVSGVENPYAQTFFVFRRGFGNECQRRP